VSEEVDVDQELLAKIEKDVLWLTLNRPDAGNAITPRVRNRMIEHLDDANTNFRVRAVVVTAVGEKHFCTGADLRAGGVAMPERPEGAPDRIAGDGSRAIRTGIQRLIGRFLDCEKPIICALNGTAAGGGIAMALASDLIIAADSARLIQVFVRRGLIPDGGVVYTLPRIVGLHKAKELVFFGDDLSAADAERIGIANRVVPAAELDKVATEWAERLATAPTKAVTMTKWLLNRSFESGRHTALEEESYAQELVQATADAGEGMKSFMERRSPDFQGW
jgi:2-(1,2-epoxy-1,2-dihydrophenyl)acetyl-CoA isomerase